MEKDIEFRKFVDLLIKPSDDKKKETYTEYYFMDRDFPVHAADRYKENSLPAIPDEKIPF